jgi:hypothetical protein
MEVWTIATSVRCKSQTTIVELHALDALRTT